MIENNNTSIISDDDDRELNKYEKIDFLNKMLELGDNIINFTPLENNTNYKVRVYNFVYQDSVVTDGFTILKK